ncbi:hypothetical protein EDD86DRAFT_105316 [Gorgonomyces haynaldii]|nr:hypothetical protein EDD86DRAFT_105316 [Gorgonomyces haynaldii]
MTLHCVIRLLFHWHLQQESVEHMRIAIVLDTLAISLASLLTAYVVRFLLQMAGMTHIYNSPVFEKAIKVIRLTLFVTYLTLIGLWLWSLSQVWRRAAYLLIACNCLFFTFPVIRFVGSRLVVFIQQSVESKTQFSGPTTGHRKTRAIAFAIRAIGYYVFLVLGLCFLLILVSEWIQDPSALIAIKILCHGHFYCASFSFVIFFFYFHSI